LLKLNGKLEAKISAEPMSGLKEGDPNGNKQTEPARCCVEFRDRNGDRFRKSSRFPNGCGRNSLRAGHKAFSARRENGVFGLKSAHALGSLALHSHVSMSLTFEVGSDQEFPLSSCFTSGSAELIKIW